MDFWFASKWFLPRSGRAEAVDADCNFIEGSPAHGLYMEQAAPWNDQFPMNQWPIGPTGCFGILFLLIGDWSFLPEGLAGSHLLIQPFQEAIVAHVHW